MAKKKPQGPQGPPLQYTNPLDPSQVQSIRGSYGPTPRPFGMQPGDPFGFGAYLGPEGLKKDYIRGNAQATLEQRNQALLSILGQLNGPSMQNVYEGQSADQLAAGYRGGVQGRLSNLQSLGLANSGAAQLTQRNLQEDYGSGLLQALQQAGQMEMQRKQGLYSQLAGVSQADLARESALNQAALGKANANQAESLLGLYKTLEQAHGSAVIASILVGGAMGAAGGAGASTGGATGAATSGAATGAATGGLQGGLIGAYQGAQMSGGLGQGAPPISSYMQPQQQPQSQYQAPSQETYGSAMPMGGMSYTASPFFQSLLRGAY